MNRTKNLFMAALCAAIAAPTAVNAQVAPQGSGYLFRVKYTPKQKLNYKMSIKSPMSPSPMQMTMSTLTKSVSGATAIVDYIVTPPAGQPGGAKPQTTTVTIDNRGRILKSSAGSASQLSNLQLPANAIPIGGTWKGEANMQGVKAISTYKFIGVKNMGGVPCAQLGITMSGGMGQMKMSGTGTMYVRMADGTLQGSTIATTINVPAGQGTPNAKPMNVKMDISITRS